MYHSTVKPTFITHSLFARLLHLPRFAMAIAMSIAYASPVVLAPSLSLAQGLPSLGDTEREELSPAMERKLGEQIMRDIRQDRDYLDDEPLSEYLNNFGASLLAVRPEARGEAGYDFFFFAVRDSTLNAFALPGGFIGVHSALILSAQSESELASVLAHEIGHVAQRHIARMLGAQKNDSMIPLAAAVLAALSARSNPDAAAALLLGGQGVAIQRQLNFSREAEREADRIGFQILTESGFDTSAMITFFGRVQNASRAYSDIAPPYLQSHPLTTERIADIQARTRNQRYKQHADSLDFHLIHARVRVLQDASPQGLRDSTEIFDNLLLQKTKAQTASAKYGLAYIAFRQAAYSKAQSLLQEAHLAAQGLSGGGKNLVFTQLALDIRLAAHQSAEAVKEAEAARQQFPLSRGIAWKYADALIGARRYEDAVRYLRDQAQQYRQEPQLQERLARVYSAQGKQVLQHMALAESYALSDKVMAALDQLSIARKAPDASFYDQSVIDARERELKALWREQSKDDRKGR